MLIKRVLAGRQVSNFVLIEDNIDFRGLNLVKQIIHNHLSAGDNVHFFIYEFGKYNFIEDYPINLKENLYVHNCFNDPLNFGGLEDGTGRFNLEDILVKNKDPKKPSVVIVDSLVFLLLRFGLHNVCSAISKFIMSKKLESGSTAVRLVGVFHSDVFDYETKEYQNINYLATTVIKLEAGKSKDQKQKVSTHHRKSSGKVVKEFCTAELDKEGKFVFKEVKSKPSSKAPVEEVPDLEWATFKLSLTEEEIATRSQIKLPYLKNNRVPKPEKGKIFYEPDAQDDWDDEDPDDDLEI